MEILRECSNLLDSNTFVLKKGKTCIIVDCGVSIEKILPLVKKLKVIAILLTHGHFDHTFNLETYLRFFNCPVIASKFAKQTLENPVLNYADIKFSKFENFMFFDKDKKITIEDFDIKCFIAKGHSECSAFYLIEKNIFVGDTVFFKGIGRYDLTGSNKEAIIKTLDKLLKINFDFCHSGHYESTSQEEQTKNVIFYIKRLTRK